jgi:pyridoxine 5-phosphate synthase
MALLTINLDHIAALREVRKLKEPDPAQAAVLAELAGADGISVQLRRNRKVIRDRDLYILREVVKTRLVMEMAPVDEFVEKAVEVKPSSVMFLADHADTDAPASGIDFTGAPINFSDYTMKLKGLGIGTCFLIEPEIESVKGVVKSGGETIMINCAGYTQARSIDEAQQELDRIDRAAQTAEKHGLGITAGHGIGYKNVQPLVELGLIGEFVVGHAIVSRAVLCGLDQAVREMVRLVRPNSR